MNNKMLNFIVIQNRCNSILIVLEREMCANTQSCFFHFENILLPVDFVKLTQLEFKTK